MVSESARKTFLDQLAVIVGDKGMIRDPSPMAPYLREWRGRFQGQALAVVRPDSVDAVSAVVRLARDHCVAIVPQAGNTSLVGASIPDGPADRNPRDSIILSVSRLNRIRAVDAGNYTMTVEAGCILQDVQTAAREVNRLMPLSLGAEGTCQIGGNLGTNAGGVMTLRYGNARDLVLGLEVVLPSGEVWNGLRHLRKNNTGYDLKHLFIGGEGTLGIITAAVLKLFPLPARTETALIGLASPADAVALFSRLREATGDMLSAFELMPRIGLDFSLKHIHGTADPLDAAHPWYVLLEMSAGSPRANSREILEVALGTAFEDGLIADAVVAESESQRQALWFLREALVESQRSEGGSIKHDISVPVSRVAEFIDRATATVAGIVPGCRPIPFGHIGDGNIHFNVTQPEGMERQAYMAEWDSMTHAVHAIALDLGGSISAEHGIGRVKRAELGAVADPAEIAMMRTIKQAIDPDDLMNPGRLIPDPPS